MLRIYVAGPYTKGDVAVNVTTAVRAADSVLRAGHIPFVPHLTHFWHLLEPHDYETWLAYDFEWLRQCDAMIRLPGESVGADREETEARRLGMPVLTLEAFLEHVRP